MLPFLRRRAESALAEEIQHHIDEAAADLILQGFSPHDARDAARKQFGNATLIKERSRDVWGGRALEPLFMDLRYALRQLRKSPGFAVAVILTLALGIGANTAIFSVVDAVLLRPLPYAEPSRLLCLWRGDEQSYPWYTFSYPRFRFFQEHSRDVADLAAYDDEAVTFSGGGEPVRLEGGRVSSNFFSLLGVKPVIGRDFLPAEDRHGGTPVVLLSNDFWRKQYEANPAILGRTARIDGEEFTIIGVLPAGFQFQGQPVAVWRSRMVDTRTFAPASVSLGASYLTIVGRLHPGVNVRQAQAKMAVLSEAYRDANRGNSDIVGSVHTQFLHQKLFAPVQMTLLVLWGSVVCLLVIACANVASLVLARITSRFRDIGVRIALGAGWARIAQQLVTESILLSLCGAVVALPIALWGMRSLALALDRSIGDVPGVRLDFEILLFTFVIATVVGIVFGLTPMLMIERGRLQGGLRSSGRGFSAGRWTAQLRNAIVAGQVALCIVLLTAAALLTQSFLQMSKTGAAFRPDRVLMFSLDLMPDRYQSWQSRVNFYDEVMRRVGSLPGVEAAGIASKVNLVASGLGYLVQVEGAPDLGSRNPGASGRSITPGYFNVVGIPLLRGRAFTPRDTSSSSRVMIVNQAFAKRFFPGQDPIGKHVTYSTDRITCEIVGLVRDVRSSLQDAAADEEIYLPLSQRPWLVAKLLVRTAGASGIASIIGERLRAVDPGQSVDQSLPLDQVISNRLGRPRTAMSAVLVFAASALLLAAIGIYGIVAYTVAQRRKEIGIRMALGAGPGHVRSLVFRQSLRLLLAGSIAGLPLALLLSRVYASLLYGVKPTDAATLIGVIAVLGSVALAASYLPASRAAHIDPAVVLHAD